MAKKKKKKEGGYTRENRPSGVSKSEWDKARKAEGRDPYAKSFSDPVADRKRQEAVRRSQQTQTLETPQRATTTPNLTPQAQPQADSFIAKTFGGIQTPQNILTPKLGTSQRNEADEFIKKVFGQVPQQSSPAGNFRQSISQVAEQQQAQPQEVKPTFRQGIVNLIGKSPLVQAVQQKSLKPFGDAVKKQFSGKGFQMDLKGEEASKQGMEFFNTMPFGPQELTMGSGIIKTLVKAKTKEAVLETAKKNALRITPEVAEQIAKTSNASEIQGMLKVASVSPTVVRPQVPLSKIVGTQPPQPKVNKAKVSEIVTGKKPVVTEKISAVEPRISVGTNWESPKGKRTISDVINIKGEEKFVVTSGGSTFGEIISKNDLKAEMLRDNKNLASNAKNKIISDTEKKTEEAIQAVKNETSGFLEKLTPMQAGKAKNALNKELRYNGEITTKKRLVENVASEKGSYAELKNKKTTRDEYVSPGNYKQVTIEKPEYRLFSKDDTFVTVSKTEFDYFEHLKKQPVNKQAIKEIVEGKKPVAPDPLTQEASKYKSAEEFVKKEPTYYHATTVDNASSIEKNGFSGEVGELSKASHGDMQKGVFLYDEAHPAETFGKNFERVGKKSTTIETKVQGKIYDANTQTKYGWEDDLQTQEIASNPKILAQLKKDGYVGVTSTEVGTNATFVFEPSAIKTKSQLTDIWNKANGEAIPAKMETLPTATLLGEAPKKQRGFIETIRQSDQTDDALRTQLEKSTGYDPITNKETVDNAKAMVDRNINEAESFVLGADKPSAGHTATAIELIKRHQFEGNFEKASEIAENVAEKLTEAGQTIQAAKLYENLSPEGVIIRAKKLIKQANDNKWRWQKDVELSDDTHKQLYDLTTQMRGATGELKGELASDIGNVLNSLKRVGAGKKVSTGLNIFQLLNPKTLLTRNPVGNELFYRVEKLNKFISTPIDWTRSTLTGSERTITFKTVKQGEYWKNWVKGAKAGWKGQDLNVASQFDLPAETFKSKWNPLRYAEKLMGAGIKSFDNAAFMRAKNETIGELAFLKAKNQGLKGKEAVNAAIEFAKKADDNILQIADDYGKYLTFQDNNVLSKGFSAVKRGLNVGQDFGAGNFVINYPKTPGALLMRGIEYSPAGFLRSAYIVGKPFLKGGVTNPREATMALSRAITGTLGFAGLGYYLADVGIITGKTEKDKDLRAFEKTTGQGQYKVNLSALKRWTLGGFDREAAKKQEGDSLYSYDWAQPVAISVSLGANANQTHKMAGAETPGVIADSFIGGVDTLQEQSLVTGISRIFGYGDIKGGISATAQGVPASFTPTLANQFRQYKDNQARNTYDPDYGKEALNMAKNKIPGQAQDLPVSYDINGKPREIYQDGSNNLFNVFFNPGFATTLKETPESKMVMDIFEQSGETQQIPRVTATKQKVNGVDTQLTPEQNSQFQKFVGEKTAKMFEALVNDKTFATLSDEDKAKKMSNIMTDIGKLAKVEILGDKGDAKTEQEILGKMKYDTTYREIDKLFTEGKDTEAYNRINRLQGDEKTAFSQIRADEKPEWYTKKEEVENPMKETFDKVKVLMLDGKDDEANKTVANLSDSDYKKYVSLRTAWRAGNTTTIKEKLKVDEKDAYTFYSTLPQKEKQRIVNGLSQKDYNNLMKNKK